MQYSDKTKVPLSTSCNCGVVLTVNDIVDISFKPFLQEIIFLVSTSLMNKQLFGKYTYIQYIFHLICFNYNLQFQPILIAILKNKANQFMYEQSVDIPHYVIPKLSSRLLQHVIQQRPFSYKGFRVGVLHHVYSDNYAVVFDEDFDLISYIYENDISYTKMTLSDEVNIVPLFKKGIRISTSRTNRAFYLKLKGFSSVNTLLLGKLKYDNITCNLYIYVLY